MLSLSPDFWQAFFRLVTLQDSNTRVVLIGTGLLGAAAGVVGVFALLRRRALVGDALSHAALPGLCVAFMYTGEKSLFALLIGALVSGILGVAVLSLIARFTRVSEDAAIGIVLSVFFGAGICLGRHIQNTMSGNQSGLESFIYGKAASLLGSEAWLIAGMSALVVVVCFLFFKEFCLVCFDRDYGQATGWPVGLIDGLLMACVITTTVVGLQTVGVVLIIALLITPSAAARFWSDRIQTTVILSSIFGAVSAIVGAALSALSSKIPTGPVIVLVAAFIFVVSLLCAPKKGLIRAYLTQRQLQRKVGSENLLRAVFEHFEDTLPAGAEPGSELYLRHLAGDFTAESAVGRGRMSSPELKRAVSRASAQRLIERWGGSYRLTHFGVEEAVRVVRNHRLWELYLINYADVAPSHVDRSADRIEHVLSRDTIEVLEQELLRRFPTTPLPVPPSPHVHEAVR